MISADKRIFAHSAHASMLAFVKVERGFNNGKVTARPYGYPHVTDARGITKER